MQIQLNCFKPSSDIWMFDKYERQFSANKCQMFDACVFSVNYANHAIRLVFIQSIKSHK